MGQYFFKVKYVKKCLTEGKNYETFFCQNLVSFQNFGKTDYLDEKEGNRTDEVGRL